MFEWHELVRLVIVLTQVCCLAPALLARRFINASSGRGRAPLVAGAFIWKRGGYWSNVPFADLIRREFLLSKRRSTPWISYLALDDIIAHWGLNLTLGRHWRSLLVPGDCWDCFWRVQWQLAGNGDMPKQKQKCSRSSYSHGSYRQRGYVIHDTRYTIHSWPWGINAVLKMSVTIYFMHDFTVFNLCLSNKWKVMHHFIFFNSF